MQLEEKKKIDISLSLGPLGVNGFESMDVQCKKLISSVMISKVNWKSWLLTTLLNSIDFEEVAIFCYYTFNLLCHSVHQNT